MFVARLRALTALTDADAAELEAVIAPPQTIARDRAVAIEGDLPEQLHILEEGWAARAKMLPDGRRHLCALLIPGDLCDVDGLHVRAYDYGVVTLTACRVAAVDRRALLALGDRRPAILRALAWLGFVDNALLNEAATSLALRSASQRLAHLLCELRARLAAIGQGRPDGYDLPITQERLSEALGLTSVHTNRTLRVLRERGLADFQGGRLVAADWRKLRDEAGFSPAYLHLEGMRGGPAA